MFSKSVWKFLISIINGNSWNLEIRRVNHFKVFCLWMFNVFNMLGVFEMLCKVCLRILICRRYWIWIKVNTPQFRSNCDSFHSGLLYCGCKALLYITFLDIWIDSIKLYLSFYMFLWSLYGCITRYISWYFIDFNLSGYKWLICIFLWKYKYAQYK